MSVTEDQPQDQGEPADLVYTRGGKDGRAVLMRNARGMYRTVARCVTIAAARSLCAVANEGEAARKLHTVAAAKASEVYHTYDDVAGLLQVEPRTVRSWVAGDLLRATKFTPMVVRIADSELKRFIRRRSRATRKPRG